MIEEPRNLAPRLLQTTRIAWRGAGLFQEPRSNEEPPHIAWRRLFGQHMPLPVFAAPMQRNGTDVVVQIMPEGRVYVQDPIHGNEIREIPPDLRVQVERAANASGACQP